MNQALWIAKTGLDAQQMRMSVVSNNLANTNTTGFKQDRASFEDLLYQQVRQPGGSSSAQTQLPTGLQLGTGVRVVATAKNEQGGQQQTGRALDVMVNGRGFFECRCPMAARPTPVMARSRSTRTASWSPTAATRCSRASRFPKARSR
jgi:flagellar basal-body rod protein FlgG